MPTETKINRDPKVTIIIRTRNEERWIGRCLRMVFAQTETDFEVVIVDNNSTDNTLHIAKKFPVRILTIDAYKPGASINVAIRNSKSKYISCLSAHCIPKDRNWLSALVSNLDKEPTVAGVYGRQLPFAYSSDLDKRDLLITFGLDARIQKKDYFFHNANSLFRRDAWDKIPFDETATNIEDRIWGKQIIESGLHLAYEPEAAVYHYHGIHQARDEARAQGVVRLMETLADGAVGDMIPEGFHPSSISVLNVVPVMGSIVSLDGINLLERCLRRVAASQYAPKTVVVSENRAALDLAEANGVLSLSRPKSLAEPGIGVEEVIKYALAQMEQKHMFFDAVMYSNYQYAFHPERFYDAALERFCATGADTVLPSIEDYLPCWLESGGKIIGKDAALKPRGSQSPAMRGLAGLGTITSSEFIRSGNLLGDRISFLPVKSDLFALKAGQPFGDRVISMALKSGTAIFGVEHGD